MSEHEQRVRDAMARNDAGYNTLPEFADLRALLADVAALRKELDEARAETRVHDNVAANLRTDFRIVQRALADEQDKTVKLAADLARVTEERNEWRHAAGELTGTVNRVANQRDALAAKLTQTEAKLDRVMLEHCPDEMSEEQRARWAAHQRAEREAER